MGAANRVEIGGYDPDYIMNIYSCPWFAQFQKMGAGEAGKAYCSVLDASISRGFNPDIRYEVPQTLHTHDHCVQIVRNAGLTPEMKIEKYMPGVRSFEYHCAHTFWSPERGFRRDLRGRRRKGQRRSLRGLCKRIRPGDGGYHCRL